MIQVRSLMRVTGSDSSSISLVHPAYSLAVITSPSKLTGHLKPNTRSSSRKTPQF